MGTRRKSSTPELNNFKIPSSWVPMTPIKPATPEPRPICTDRQENQLGQANWFVQERISTQFPRETQGQILVSCGESTNSMNIKKGLDSWEAVLAAKSQAASGICIGSEFMMDTDRVNSGSFANLLALAEAAATTKNPANAAQHGNVNDSASSSFISTFSPQCEGNQLQASSSSLPPAKIDNSFRGNLWSDSIWATDTLLCGTSAPSRFTYDLNSPPRAAADTFSSRNIPFQFAPITPDQSLKAQNNQADDIQCSNIINATDHARDKQGQGNEVATTRIEVEEIQHDKEQQQLPKDLPTTAVSTELQEDHDPDNAGNSSIDLNRTPQQKPRRKKHRPKVVIEGQLKRTPKPKTPNPVEMRENPTKKRKYVRRNKVNETSGTTKVEVASRNDDQQTPTRVTRSSRRKLDFDFESEVREKEYPSCRSQSNISAESQAQNFCTRVESTSNVQLGQRMELKVGKAGVGYDLTSSLNREFEDYISMLERQAPTSQNPAEINTLHEKLKADVPNEVTRGKCRIVFSDETHDKQEGRVKVTSKMDTQSAPRSPNDSNCSSSSTCLAEGEQAQGLKRAHLCTNAGAEPSRRNTIGNLHNSWQGYLPLVPPFECNKNGIQGMYFPANHKRKRTEKGQSLTTPSTFPTVTAAENSARQAILWPLNSSFAALNTPENNDRFSAAQINTKSATSKPASLADAQSAQKTFERQLDLRERMTKKRSKGPTRVRDSASLFRIVECRQSPISPDGGAPRCSDMQGYGISHHHRTGVEALLAHTHATMKTKKRTKRRYFPSSFNTVAVQKETPSIDEIVEQLKITDINRESNQFPCRDKGALVPYNFRYEQQNALVLYQRDGTLVPFEGLFDPVRRRRPRPKVDLDEETNRVWKLLLENINNEGIDGTDEQKAKWWEEERSVFQGRADSFIARMHLVQGDRRFTPWKGSVVDSVVGVFLTQNVSDHLSSSAFMSLAARFPLKSENNCSPCFEETSSLTKELEACILEPEDTIKWHEEKSNEPACSRNSIPLHDIDYNVEQEVVNGSELHRSSSCEKSTNNLKCKSSGIYENGIDMHDKSTVNRAVESFTGDKREMDSVLLHQYSVGFSQNSPDSSMAQNAEGIGSCSQENLKAGLATRSYPNGHVGSSFLELLQRAETFHGLYNHNTACTPSCSKNQESSSEGTESEMHKQNKEGSNNSKASLRPIAPPSNCLSQMPSPEVVEVESFDVSREESQSSEVSKKIEENCTSEQSGVTAESINQGTYRKMVTGSFQEAIKSPNEKIHVCRSHEGEVNKSLQSQNWPIWKPKDNIQSQTPDHNCRMQEVLEVPYFSTETLDITASTSTNNDQKNTEHKEVESCLKDHGYLPGEVIDGKSSDRIKVNKGRIRKQKQETVDWDSLRMQAQAKGKRREKTANTMDSLDWEAVRCADVNDIADTIKERGMNNMLAERIKDFLNRVVREHGSIDLEWLRDVPPDKAKEYLLSFRGLGLKSVECVRLLTLHHLAFPVDTNVGRIAVRLGWVPLQPLPESLQLHLLELYPVLESIQRYLWPRLCKLDQRTLYELHYQMITFGKVFCTKSKPNCNACPMRGECRHFASAFASARLALPGPEEKSLVSTTENKTANAIPANISKLLQLPLPQANEQLQVRSQMSNFEPIIHMSSTPEPIVEVPATPEPEHPQVPEFDIEDAFGEDPEEIPTIKLNIEEFTQNLQNYMQQNMELQDGEMSKALVALTSEAASIPMPKLKNVSRLRTEHQVYELPDSHPLLEGLDKREPDDPCSYLLAIWTPGETADSIQPPERKCSSQEFGELCNESTCFACNSIREANSQTVRGTLLIPCRTAMRGSFPLNGTYFQVNEVFADHDSSINPIDVPRAWIWNLPRRTVYFGTSIPTIFKGLSTECIQYCFWRGFVCVRGFDQKTRAPRPLMARLHFPASKLSRTQGKTNEKHE